MPYDSTGKIVIIGSKVKFRGQEYTIKDWHEGKGCSETCQFEFEEKQHTNEIADEISIDLISL